jgi:hypothetical protein
MPADLAPLVAATARWLARAYCPGGGAVRVALCEVQAQQAVTVAAWLRYPTAADVDLVILTGPGGCARLDWVTGADTAVAGSVTPPWRTWVDEVVASWAACLLSDPALAEDAVHALRTADHLDAGPLGFRRLVAPDSYDLAAAALLRHPDLLAPVAALHRAGLLERLGVGPAVA